jgi:hypothetical protein
MKKLGLTLLALGFLSASVANAESRVYGPVGPKPSISILFVADGKSHALVDATINPKNASNIIFLIDDQTHFIDTHFHNPTEARWFMQFLEQTQAPFTMAYKGAINQTNVPVERYVVTQIGNESIKIQIDPSIDDVVLDCANQNLIPSVALAPAKTMNLDEFTDIFRFKLEEKGAWFGAEGRKDKSSKRSAVPQCN